MIIVLSGLSFGESCVNPQTCDGQYPEASRTLLKKRTTFVDSASNVDLTVGSIPLIEAIYLWMFRQKLYGLSFRVFISPESRQCDSAHWPRPRLCVLAIGPKFRFRGQENARLPVPL